MLIPILLLFIVCSVIALVIGLRSRNATVLFALNIFWASGSLLSGYLTLLVWQDRRYSENWAMIGFIFFALPYILLTASMISAELFFIRRQQDIPAKRLRLSGIVLLIFLMSQLIVGLLSA
jgi:hypothetical protein